MAALMNEKYIAGQQCDAKSFFEKQRNFMASEPIGRKDGFDVNLVRGGIMSSKQGGALTDLPRRLGCQTLTGTRIFQEGLEPGLNIPGSAHISHQIRYTETPLQMPRWRGTEVLSNVHEHRDPIDFHCQYNQLYGDEVLDRGHLGHGMFKTVNEPSSLDWNDAGFLGPLAAGTTRWLLERRQPEPSQKSEREVEYGSSDPLVRGFSDFVLGVLKFGLKATTPVIGPALVELWEYEPRRYEHNC